MKSLTKLFTRNLIALSIIILLTGVDSSSLYAQTDMPAEGVQYNLHITRGASGMLSCAGYDTDLWHTDDNSGRQKWSFKEVSPGLYNIFVYYTESSRRMLSSNDEGGVDLWHTDDNSGRQKWRLVPLGNNKYNIMVSGGVCCNKKFLSTNGEGEVDLWVVDDNSGRQQWTLIPEEIKLEDIKFDLARARKFAKPDFVTQSTSRNNTDGTSRMTFSFERKATETSSFQREHGFSFTVGVEAGFEVPGFSGSVSSEATTSNTWTYGQESSREDTRTYSKEYEILPRKQVTMYATVKMYEVSIPYTAIGTSPVSGKKITCTGTWHGVKAGEINYNAEQVDLGGGSQTPTQSSTPAMSSYTPQLSGSFAVNPVQNGWHEGRFDMNRMEWTNSAGVTWGLQGNPISKSDSEIVYQTDTRNPYYNNGHTTFTFVLENGQVTAFKFGNGTYHKTGN